MVFSYDTVDEPFDPLQAEEKTPLPAELVELTAFNSQVVYISQITAQFQFVLNS